MQNSKTGNDTRYPPAMIMPADMDWSRIFAMRRLAAASPSAPGYLLAPEISLLLSYMHDLRERCFFETLWNTGARPNEALALKPEDFNFSAPLPYVRLRTLKQRQRKPGRPSKSELPVREISLWDAAYQERMKTLIATYRIKTDEYLWGKREQDERRAVRTVSSDTVGRWLERTITRLESDGVTLTVNPVTPKTFRHSFAMHILFNRIHPKVLQTLMGHSSFKSTEVYTRLFLFDMATQHKVNFSYDIEDARDVLTDLHQSGRLMSK